jgi:uncharacterized damage-inducible protein DinB
MDAERTYDYLTLARGKLLDWVRPLSQEQYVRAFPIGLGSLARTLAHVELSEWYYIQRMRQRTIPPYEQWPIRDESPPPFAEIEAAWSEQAKRTRAALSAVRDWSAPIEYEVTTDEGRRDLVTASAGDIFTQLVLHEVHHRAQAMNMLRHLGVKAEDIDFNTLMYRRRPRLE